MVSWVYTYVKTYQSVYFEYVQFIVYQLYLSKAINQKIKANVGAVAQACNPSTLGGQRGQIIWAQESESSVGNIETPQFCKK